MGELERREQLERQLAKALSALGPDLVKRLSQALGDPPRLSNLRGAVWERMSADMRAVLQPVLEQVYLAMARQTLDALPAEIDWAQPNERAAAWAEAYAGKLVRGITETTRLRLGRDLAAYFREATTVGELASGIHVPELVDVLGRVIMPDTRAEMIAQTEITRAADQGQAAVVAQVKADNPAVRLDEFWETNRDEFVCVICGGLQGVKGDGRGYFLHPNGTRYSVPAHPRCRCQRRMVLLMPGTRRAVLL